MKKILSFLFVLIFLAVPSSELYAQKRKQKKVEKDEIIMPSYPGGEKALLNFIMSETEYPFEARVKNEIGEVLVAFSIGMDGYISGVRVLRSVSPSLDAEAVRVVKKMKPWFPGKKNGVPVRAEMTIPINFKIIHEHGKYVPDEE
ncbi:MAG: energy transducer TonB [Bacteroidaceae bacterium]|nr:energy transducer TonB [Bacteroidaceae bacterium]